MKIQEKDSYHGAALTQIVEHPSFKALNKADSKYGHYLVNVDIHVLMKYSTASKRWQFTFQPDDLRTLCADIHATGKTFACLVCGRETVCLLEQGHVRQLLDLDAKGSQWIRVIVRPGGSLHANGSQGRLLQAITHKAFPDDIFK